MNLNLFIAERIGKKTTSDGKLSRISNTIATISVGLSIAVMILAIAIANGFREEIREKASGFNGDITLSAPGVDIQNHLFTIKPLSFIDKIDSLQYVSHIQPVFFRTGILKNRNQIHGVVFKGVDSSYNMQFFKQYLVAGEIPQYASSTRSSGGTPPLSNDILISKRLADILHLNVGDKTTAYFIDENVTPRRFTIKGIFDAQLDEIDKSLIIADSRHISRLNGWKEEQLNGYEIILNKKGNNNVEICKETIEEILYKYTKEEDSSVVANTIQERFYILFDWLHLLDMNVLIILSLMIAVAGFNMVSGLLIILFERISQIGLLKALGMQNKSISKIFLYRAAFIVGKGLLIGNLLSLLICFIESRYKIISLDPANYFISYVPIDIQWHTVLGINLIAFALIMAILLVPCHLISRVSPSRTLITK